MEFAVTTRWNASRHETGEAVIEEILALGVNRVELGYDTRRELVPGMEAMQKKGLVHIDTVHNFCPLPEGIHRGHPELWTFASLDADTHRMSVVHTENTIHYAGSIGAKVVVAHSGYVHTRKIYTHELITLFRMKQLGSRAYTRTSEKLLKVRSKKLQPHLDQVYRAVEALLPSLEANNVVLGLENMPTMEAVPNEEETVELIKHFDSPWVKYWHDLGHGQIRENLGFIDHLAWLEEIQDHIAGMHVHDVARGVNDHTMPPDGDLGLDRFLPFARLPIPLVIEPTSRATSEQLENALAYLKYHWVKAED